MYALLETLVLLAGAGQLMLCVCSIAIPRVMNWHGALADVRPLIRQMFWNYAVYILAINACFGVLSLIAPELLLDRSPLAACVTGFIAAYWIGRVAAQFLYFDRSDVPPGRHVRLAGMVLETAFVALSLTYLAALLLNLGVVA